MKALLSSKKFVTLAGGVLTLLLINFGMDEDAAEKLTPLVAALVATYLVGQGVADHGKEAAKIKANE